MQEERVSATETNMGQYEKTHLKYLLQWCILLYIEDEGSLVKGHTVLARELVGNGSRRRVSNPGSVPCDHTLRRRLDIYGSLSIPVGAYWRTW